MLFSVGGFSFHNTLVWEAGLHVKSGTFVSLSVSSFCFNPLSFVSFLSLIILHSFSLLFLFFSASLSSSSAALLSPSPLFLTHASLYPSPLLSPFLPVNLLHFPPALCHSGPDVRGTMAPPPPHSCPPITRDDDRKHRLPLTSSIAVATLGTEYGTSGSAVSPIPHE